MIALSSPLVLQPHAPSRGRPSQRLRPLFALLLTLLLVLGVLMLPTAAPARAATIGRMVSVAGWEFGTFLSSTGHFVYCAEPGGIEPAADQHGPEAVSELPGYAVSPFDPTGWSGPVSSGPLNGEALRQMNYLLWQHGRTDDVDAAAAVQLAVWLLRDDPGVAAWMNHHFDWLRGHGGGQYIDRAQELVAEARAQAVPAARPEPESLRLDFDGDSGTVAYPAGTATLRISGGAFAGGGTELAVAGGEAGLAEWRATLHDDGWQGRHAVEITAEWRLPASGWPDQVVLHPPTVDGQQRLTSGVGPVVSDFTGALSIRETLDVRFRPVLSTRVPEGLIAPGGDRFADTVTIELAEGSAPWPSRSGIDGVRQYAPVVAEGTVYGPFEHPVQPSTEVPGGAPVAGRVELVADRGNGSYEIETDESPRSAGYYSWVWRLRESAQTEEVRAGGLLPEGYDFADGFGLAEEGQMAPMELRFDTELDRTRLTAEELELRDTVAAQSVDGIWLRDEAGARIPGRVRLTVYQSDSEPQRQALAPENAQEIAHSFVSVAQPGEGVVSDEIRLPAGVRGWVTVQACLLIEDQPENLRDYFVESCDDYGVPAETARVVGPELSETGAPALPLMGASLWGGGLAAAGAAALLAGGVLRRRGVQKERTEAEVSDTEPLN